MDDPVLLFIGLIMVGVLGLVLSTLAVALLR